MFPYDIVDIDEHTNEKLLSHFSGERSGFCQIGPQKWILPHSYKDHAEAYFNTEIRSDDTWIVTFPRSGTTWCQELVWLINNNLDYEKAAATCLDERFPFLEFRTLLHSQFLDELESLNDDPNVLDVIDKWRVHGYETLPNISSPRHVKTHLPYSLLPPKLTETCKSLYVARNAKDVAVSYFYHNKLLNLHGYKGSFDQYWNYFEKNNLVYSPYFNHVKEGWAKRDSPNVLFLFYEDMIKDLPSAVKKVANFLNKPLTANETEALVKHLHIDNFRKFVKVHGHSNITGLASSSVESFFRQGKVGESKEFNAQLSKKAEEWIKKNLEGTDLVFPSKSIL